MARRGAVTWLASLAVLWGVLLLAAPALSRQHDGRAAMLATVVHVAASRVCHQRPERSFFIDGVQLPVCGRCLALYLTGAAGLLIVAGAASLRPSLVSTPWPAPGRLGSRRPEAWWLAVAAAPVVVVAVGEWTLADPGTWARALATAPLGLVVGLVCGVGLARPAAQPLLLH